MRVLFTVSDWTSHYFPMVPLGWALQSAGHEVRVVCPPRQAGPLGRAGLTPVPVLGDLDMSFLSRFVNLRAARAGHWPYPGVPLPHPVTREPLASPHDVDFDALARETGARVGRETARGADAAVRFARRWRPHLVVHDRLSMDGVLAARAVGVPHVAHLWGTVGTHEDDPALHPLPVDRTGEFARFGLPPMGPELIEHVIDPCPAELAPPTGARRMPVRYVPYNGPGQEAGWRPEGDGGRPRVCLIWSNSVTQIYGRASYAVPEMVKAAEGLDADVVLLAHPDDRAALGDLPRRVTVLEQYPLRLVLPHCDALVHHGGAGTLMTAVAHGVPQLSVAFGAEQETDGRRLATAGAGLTIPGHEATAATIGEALTRLLTDPAHRAAAARLSEANAARPAPSALVPQLERLAGASGGDR
ncbi:nucleotide disphospho-sugar-binding domain-containing protein [Streptomyces varsoviensis]|nr:nucleotide disphospho-sugar-binding domain-containing protein [Streptomyces varsoviensis]